MATFTKNVGKKGTTYTAKVRIAGAPPERETFDSLAEARIWAKKIEADIVAGRRGIAPTGTTVGDMLRKYIEEILPGKDGARQERFRLERLFGKGAKGRRAAVQVDPLVSVPLRDFAAPHVNDWKRRRLAEVAEASVNREWNTLSKCCTIAMKDWKWLSHNPFHEATRPEDTPPRTRRPTAREIDRLTLAAGYEPGAPLGRGTTETMAAFLLAIETAIRIGELCLLRREDIDWKRRVAHITAIEKGGRKAGKIVSQREVPLSAMALDILRQFKDNPTDYALGLSAKNVDINWRHLCERAMVEDLHFHDSRREALTRLAKRFEVMELAKISGHKNLRELLDTYYAPDVAEFADRLDDPPPERTARKPPR